LVDPGLLGDSKWHRAAGEPFWVRRRTSRHGVELCHQRLPVHQRPLRRKGCRGRLPPT